MIQAPRNAPAPASPRWSSSPRCARRPALRRSGWGDTSLVTLATRMIIFAIAAASLNLALGYGGMVSFGHAAFLGIGAYTVGHPLQPLRRPGTVRGLHSRHRPDADRRSRGHARRGLAAAAIGALSLRTGGVQFIMITLAFAQMVFFLFVSLKAYGGDDGLIMRRRNALPGSTPAMTSRSTSSAWPSPSRGSV
jgi:branched-chain amino acid transport system permease protein